MSLKSLKPINSSSRHAVLLDKGDLSNSKPYKPLLKSLSSTGGRNNLGRVTAYHMGGGHKKRYRLIDFKGRRDGSVGSVESVEYDPCRTAHISLVKYADNDFSYILAPDKLKVGLKVIAGEGQDIVLGNSLPLKDIPIGVVVHNIELKPGKGGQVARAAGCYAQVMGKDKSYILLKLRSGKMLYVLSSCYATIGSVSNPNNKNIKLGKAGRNRWRGVRPTVRGVAMNPVDHPLGGGEGKTSGGRHPVSPWGLLSKGKKTRHKTKK